MTDFFNYRYLCTEVLSDQQKAINWCIDVGLLGRPPKCPKCPGNVQMGLSKKGTTYRWRCRKGGDNIHDEHSALYKNSWFSGSNWPIDKIIGLTYWFSVGTTKYEDLVRELRTNEDKASSKTISNWLSFCREVCDDWCVRQEKNLIGGPGKVVQVDESKVGKRKYNKGRIVEGHWILGMIEWDETNPKRKGGEFRVEVCPNNKRNADTLIPLIKKHVLPDTVIFSDEWGGYFKLNEHGYEHHTVCHEDEWVNSDPNEKGVHTQCIEAHWTWLKKNVKEHRRADINKSICEHLWRRHVKIYNLDSFKFFIDCIKDYVESLMAEGYFNYK